MTQGNTIQPQPTPRTWRDLPSLTWMGLLHQAQKIRVAFAHTKPAHTTKARTRRRGHADAFVHTMLQIALWGGFAFFLLASLPHVAYFFATFESGTDTSTFWGWLTTYGPALAIDLTAFLLSFVLARRIAGATAGQPWYLKVVTALPSLLLLLPFILALVAFSWLVNFEHAIQFHTELLAKAEAIQINLLFWKGTIGQFNPVIGSAFPVLAVAYTAMADHIRNEDADEDEAKPDATQASAPAPAPMTAPTSELTQVLQAMQEMNLQTLQALHQMQERSLKVQIEQLNNITRVVVQEVRDGLGQVVEALPERVERTTEQVRALPPGANKPDGEGSSGERKGGKGDEVERFIKANPNATVDQIAAGVPCSKSTAAKWKNRLTVPSKTTNTNQED